MNYVFIVAALAGAFVLVAATLGRNPLPAAIASIQSDETRLGQIAGSGTSQDGIHTLFQPVKLNNRDVKLIRRDVRRAMAAYPDVDEDRLLTSRWFAFDETARVPTKGFWNSHGTQDPITKEWYLESAYMSVVRPEYTNRADDAATDSFFAARKAKREAEQYTSLKEEGPFAAWGGTGGSMSVRLDKNTGNVVIQRAKEWDHKVKRWTMPFVIDEWVGVNASDLEAIKKLPSFAHAVEEEIDVEPSGVSISFGSQGSTGGVLIPGESMTVGVPVRFR